MSFADHEYLPFLALVLVLFQLVPTRLRAATLLAASYAFYAWWSAPHALLVAGSTLLDYGVGLGLGRARARGARRALLGASLVGNLGVLVLYKYSGFLVESLNALVGRELLAAPALGLPLGISFYTFQTLSYSIDVYRGSLAPCRDPVRFALYVSFFPQLVAGPIERARHLLPQLGRLSELRRTNAAAAGLLIVGGLLQKWVLADRLRLFVWPVFSSPERQDSLSLFLAAAGMSAVLYLDFSAYTNLARGSARLFGVELVPNFRRPFVATSLSRLSARWHMSLATWIRDYVHAPFLTHDVGTLKLVAANVLTMALFGLWHGASATFLLWGIAAGVALSVEHLARLGAARRAARSGRPPRRLLPPVAGWCLTHVTWALFITLFFSPDLGFAGRWFARLLSSGAPTSEALGAFVLPLGGFLALGLALQFAGERWDLAALYERLPGVAKLGLGVLAVYVLYTFRAPAPEPFIYFQF